MSTAPRYRCGMPVSDAYDMKGGNLEATARNVMGAQLTSAAQMDRAEGSLASAHY